MHLYDALDERASTEAPIRTGIVGTGFFGGGLLRQLAANKAFRPSCVAGRTVQKASDALREAGVEAHKIRVARELDAAQRHIDAGLYVATDAPLLVSRLNGIDVAVDATGDVALGAEIALEAIRHKKHVVAANLETHATVGPILKRFADENRVVYTDFDGDQPGMQAAQFEYYSRLGFKPVASINCKGVMKRYATPDTQKAYCDEYGIRPWIATAAADGTKINIEAAAVANATGLAIAQTGMKCVQTTLDGALDALRGAGLLELDRPATDFTLGIPSGVFFVGYNDDAGMRKEMRYLKMGDGPYYLFYSQYVLCHLTGMLSVARAALHGKAAIAPKGAPVAEVATFAKRGLESGRRLDGIGGFDCYGLAAPVEAFRSEKYVPIGLAHYARLKREIKKDEPVRLDDVEIEADNTLTRLYRQQAEIFSTHELAA